VTSPGGIQQNPLGRHDGRRVWGGGIVKIKYVLVGAEIYRVYYFLTLDYFHSGNRTGSLGVWTSSWLPRRSEASAT
jgi:hypothetical protein